jgi:acetylornithine deacetylase/succinyl-diaminopimelate desuccinylase-like protein
MREGFSSEYAFRARFSYFSVSLTSPSGRKYIIHVVKLGDSSVGAGIRGVTEKGNTYPRATIQCRLLPGDDPAGVQATLARVIADSEISITMVGQAYPGMASPLRQDLFLSIERITSEMWPEVQTMPVMDPWTSDGVHFRRAGIPVYGLSGIFFDMNDNRSHGKDERVGVREFYEGVEFMYRVMRTLADK